MTKDDILTAAREAGFEVVGGQLRLYFDGSKALLKPNYMGTVVDGLKEFATLVAAHEKKFWMEQIEVECNEAVLAEREACAKVCEEFGDISDSESKQYAKHFAAAIRARSEK